MIEILIATILGVLVAAVVWVLLLYVVLLYRRQKTEDKIIPTKGNEMREIYEYHKPSADGLEKITTLRKEFSLLHDTIDALAPNSREKSVALTNLESAAMWAIKAIVVNDLESVPEE